MTSSSSSSHFLLKARKHNKKKRKKRKTINDHHTSMSALIMMVAETPSRRYARVGMKNEGMYGNRARGTCRSFLPDRPTDRSAQPQRRDQRSRQTSRVGPTGRGRDPRHHLSSAGQGRQPSRAEPSRQLGRLAKGQATLCVQSAQYRTRSSEIAFLCSVLVWLGTCIPYQLNIVSDYAITQYRTNASEIAHLVRIVCSGLNTCRL